MLTGGIAHNGMAARIGKSSVSTPFDQAWNVLKDYGHAQQVYDALMEWEDTPHMEEARHVYQHESEFDNYTPQHHADRYVQMAMAELGIEGEPVSVASKEPDTSPSLQGQRQRFHYTMPDGSPLGLSVMEDRDIHPVFGMNRVMSIFGSPVREE